MDPLIKSQLLYQLSYAPCHKHRAGRVRPAAVYYQSDHRVTSGKVLEPSSPPGPAGGRRRCGLSAGFPQALPAEPEDVRAKLAIDLGAALRKQAMELAVLVDDDAEIPLGGDFATEDDGDVT